ncbi:hypothetical protein FRC10_001702 [Ceratobasidium sp. 414]|nr:hypothetical protein FRC10_001702 [Ceratobasidium sp. 414]
MNTNPEAAYNENAQAAEANHRRFTTPLRRAFKRLKVTRKKQPSGAASNTEHALADRSNYLSLASEGRADVDDQLQPPPAPRLSRRASPMDPPSPISPLPTTVSRSSNILTIRSGMISASGSRGSIQGFGEPAPSSSSPAAPMPRGDLFQLGLTPVQSMRSIGSFASGTAAHEPRFAPALPTAQRVSTVNIANETSEVDILEVLDMDTDTDAHPGQVTPTPRRTSVQWLPSLSIERHATHNPSTTAVFESSNLAQPRRTSFMSRLVGSAWGLAGIGFTSMNVHRRTQSAAMPTVGPALSPLPPILLGRGPIERVVFDPNVTTSRLSAGSTGSRRHLPANELPPANSTMRMTGSKSRRAFDNLGEELGGRAGPTDAHVKLEGRPKKKRRSGANEVRIVFGPFSSNN